MTAAALTQLGQSGRQPHGWLASAMVHGVALSLFIIVFSELKPAAQPEPFRWEIALAQVAPPSPQVEPPAPVQPQPKPVVQPPAPAKPVERKPVVQQVQTIQPVNKVEQIIRREQVAVQQVNPVVESIAQHAESVQQESQPVETTEVVQRVERIEAAPATQAIQHEQILNTESAPVVSEITTQPEPIMTNEPVVEQASSVNQQSTVNHSAHQPIETSAHVEQTARVAASQTPVERPAPVTAQTKADYSWLTQELLSRLERSKRYPYAARMNRWEGRVVVQAVVRDDGQVVSLQIAQSSGHAILDNDAIELIRKISPLHLKHPLGQAQVALLVPVGYALR